METYNVETEIQKPEGTEPLPHITLSTKVSEKSKEKLKTLKDIQKTKLIKSSSLPKLPNDKNNSTNYFDDNLRKLGTENKFNKRSASFHGSHLFTNYADTYFTPETRLMINELEKHADELARSQDQINMFLPREIINKLKMDRSSLYKQKFAEEDEEFESDATSDYSVDDEEDDVQEKVLSEEPDPMFSNDQKEIVDDDPEKAWKDFNWNSNIDVTTMKSQSLRNSYRASGSFNRNSYHTTFKNASLQQNSRSNCKNINIQQWKKEKDAVNYNSRKIYNPSIDNKSDSSIGGSNGILIKNANNVRSDYFEPRIEELNQPSEKIESSVDNNLDQESGKHASSSSREGSDDSLLTGDALPDKMLARIVKLEFDPQSPNSKAKTSIRLIIHSVTHQTKPNSSYHELLKKLFLFPFDYHSFVFDTLKIDIYEHASFSYAKKKLGRAFIRLINLKESIMNRKDFEGTFPLELNGVSHPHKVGSIQIAIKFHFPSDPPLLIPKMPKPIRSKTVPSFFPSINSDKSKQIMPPSVTNTKRNVDEEVSTEISDVEDGEFAITYPENKPLGILDMVLSQETRDAIKEITVLYHAFFDHGWKLSKLEFLKAYMLLEKYYIKKPNPVTGIVCHDLERIQKAQKYLKYSMASYGSFLFNWFGYGHSKAHLNAIRINSDRKAIQEFFSLEKEDIICWEYGQKAVSVPNYMVIHDPETKSIIISIRGTMNVTDVITDALAHHEPWNGGFVHRGVLRSAKYLVKHSLKDIREAVKKFESKAIQVIGHSLGASISSIVTLLLREKCQDLIAQGIDIHAWNFATAPCCSLDLACKAETENCIDNFVNENDVIPRLSYGNLMDFKELVKFAASELKNEKYRRLSSKDKLAKILTSIDDYRTSLKSKSASQKLYIPGTIYYLYKGFYRTHVNSSEAYYTKDIVCEKSKPDLFTDISLRRNWLFHHFPDRYDKKFKGVTKSLIRKLHGKDCYGRTSDKLMKKWKQIPETEIVIEESGKMGKLMARTGHI